MSEEVLKTPVVADAPKKEVGKKKKSLPRKILEWVFYLVFALICGFVVAGNISGEIHKDQNYGQSIRFGFGSFIVLTTSMEPEIGKDSAIITYQQDLDTVYDRFTKGETIDVTFANVNAYLTIIPNTAEFRPENGGKLIVTNRIMTHRIREMYFNPEVEMGGGRYIFITSGINTQGEASLEGQYQAFTENEYLGVVVIANQFLGKIFNFIISPIGLLILLLIPAGYLIVTSTIDILKTLKTAEEQEQVMTSVDTSNRLNSISIEDKERLKKELLEELKKKSKGEKK